jgi:hypothetical protein
MARPDTGATVGGSMRRLLEAISALEEAVESRLQREQLLGEAEAEVQRMGADRSRLAEALDASAARAQRLEATNKEVSRRLVDAMEAIRTVLDGPSERPA